MKPSNSGNKGSRPWCEVLRQRGNEVYIKVSRGNLGPSLTRYNLQKAHELYEEALRVSRTSDNGASCYKNLGALNWVWAKSEWSIYQQDLTAQKSNGGAAAAKFRMAKCVEFYFKALHYGSLAMKQGQWITQIEDTLSKIVEWSSDQLYTHLSNFEPVMRVLCESVACSEAEWPGRRRMAVLLYKIHANFILGRGIQNLMSTELSGGSSEREGYKKCLNATRDCYGPLERAESILRAGPPIGYQELVNQVRDLKEEVLNYQTLCEAIQSRIQGEELLEKAMHGDMEIIWEAIDYFKHSLRVTEEKQLENEAIVLSRIGKSYSCVLKMEKQAHSYHLQSIRIALTIMSGRIANADWYIFSSQAVRKHQEEIVEQEKRENEEKRKASAERMKEKISAVQAEENKSAEAFLKYIYENCPHPDVTKQVLPPLESPENVKPALKKAILVYHPDTNRQQSDDWQVLCEEITKILNNKYVIYK